MRASFVNFIFVSLIVLSPLWATSAGADTPVFEHRAQAMVRDGEKLVKRDVVLKDLLNEQTFDGKYFRVVFQSTEIPIPFNYPDETVRLRAATAYNALTISHDAFAELLAGEPEFRRAPLETRITVRIDQDKDYSEVIHFKNTKVHNGALSIAASDPIDVQGEISWNPEIWFFIAEKVKTNGPTAQVGQVLNSPEFKQQILLGLLEQDATNIVKDVVASRFYFEPHLYSVAISFGLAELLPIAINEVTKRIKTTLYVDTAQIPEIIAHEYGHHALSTWFGFKERTHLVEGYPNYFAGRS